jgi:hypothetical protein
MQKNIIFAGGAINSENIATKIIQQNPIYSGKSPDSGESTKKYKFAINPTPSNSVVTINGEVRNNLTAEENTQIEWHVEADGYEAQSGSLVLTEDTMLEVILLSESWHQTAELNAEIKGVSSSSNGDLEAAKAAVWLHGYNDFAGNVPADYLQWTRTKALHFYVILPRKTFVKRFVIQGYNQYDINTVSYKSWSETEDEDTSNDNREYFFKIPSSEFKSSADVNAEVMRLDVYINMSGTGKFFLYGFRVET